MEEKKHFLSLENRNTLSMTGVRSVVSFRDDAVEVETELGLLQITGSDLHMEKLDLEEGKVILTGTVTSLYYPTDTAEKKGILGRLFS